MPVISGFKRLRQEDHDFEAGLVYTARTYFRKSSKIKSKNNFD